jgi:hypothetical protein
MFGKSVKKITGILAAATLMVGSFGFTMPVHAATTDFTLTVNNTGYNQDNLSKRTKKDGGTAYENKAYVRANSFSGIGTIYVKSVKLEDTSIYTGEIALRSANSVGVLKSATYNKYAQSGKYYYLQGKFGASSTGNSLTVVGRYTP